jgi:iron complex outermembrane recepter protein
VVMDSDYYVSALWSYKGDTEGVGDVAGRLDGDAFSVVDVFTGLRNDVWSAQLYVKNAFDDDGVLNRRPLNTLAYNELTVTPPRSVGITGTYRF